VTADDRLMPQAASTPGSPILLLTQGYAGDRLGARLAPALRERFPERDLVGIGGRAMAAGGVRLLARTDDVSAMGYSGLLPKLPKIAWAVLRGAAGTKRALPACVVAVDVWQPLQLLHRVGPHLKKVPHLCYLPPAPNFIGPSRVHGAVSRVFGAIVTPFPHQARLYEEAGGHVRLGAHAGLQSCREEAHPLPPEGRENLLALLPGSRVLEIRYSLPVHVRAAQQIRRRYPELRPIVCCASDEVARAVRRAHPGLECSRNAREVMARARFALICSGTAALEAAVLGCPGVVTYHGSSLQRWEYEKFHVPGLTRLRAEGIASPFFSLPNILAEEELYPEVLDVPAEAVSEAALRELAGDLREKAAALAQVTETLSWEDAGIVVAEETARLVSG
jgi:lipid-A-disaccharide synthase